MADVQLYTNITTVTYNGEDIKEVRGASNNALYWCKTCKLTFVKDGNIGVVQARRNNASAWTTPPLNTWITETNNQISVFYGDRILSSDLIAGTFGSCTAYFYPNSIFNVAEDKTINVYGVNTVSCNFDHGVLYYHAETPLAPISHWLILFRTGSVNNVLHNSNFLWYFEAESGYAINMDNPPTSSSNAQSITMDSNKSITLSCTDMSNATHTGTLVTGTVTGDSGVAVVNIGDSFQYIGDYLYLTDISGCVSAYISNVSVSGSGLTRAVNVTIRFTSVKGTPKARLHYYSWSIK